MNKVHETKLESDPRVKLWRIRSAKSGPKLLITAGIHGGENTPVQVAFELVEQLADVQTLSGQITIIPVVNVEGYKKQTRENPDDGKNINAAGTTGKFRPGEYSISDAVADEIINRAENHDYFLDLHSASKGRYLSHVYYHRSLSDMELARIFGFHFVVYHNQTKNDVKSGNQRNVPISTRVAKAGTTALTLELGAGTIVRRKDIKMALKGIVSFCRRIGMLEGPPIVKKTPRNQVFSKERNQITTVVKAPQAGNIYFKKSLGEVVKKDEVVAFMVNPQKRAFEIKSPVDGRLILKRVISKIEPEEAGKETIFRIMPVTA